MGTKIVAALVASVVAMTFQHPVFASVADVPPVAVPVASTPNDPCILGCAPYSVPWYLEAIGGSAAWEVITGSSDVMVAVVDTGIDDLHPDLSGRVTRVPGCGLGPADPFDTSHGTFIS